MTHFDYRSTLGNPEWTLSAKGNYWREMNGEHLVVGRYAPTGMYWALVDGSFLKSHFDSLEEAMSAAEEEAE